MNYKALVLVNFFIFNTGAMEQISIACKYILEKRETKNEVRFDLENSQAEHSVVASYNKFRKAYAAIEGKGITFKIYAGQEAEIIFKGLQTLFKKAEATL